jgi:hypothetical protein
MPPARIEPTRATDPPYGLIRSARIVVEGSDLEPTTDSRWVEGLTWLPEDCTGGSPVDPCGDDDGAAPSTPDVVGPHYPVILEAAVECSTFGSISDDLRTKAARKLRATRSSTLETEFWAGALAIASGWTTNQRLNDPAGTLIEGGFPVGVITGLAELEQAIANGSDWGTGMIHAQPRTVTQWAAENLLEKVGDLLVTKLGTVVVAGRGYPGTGPTDAINAGVPASPADGAWAFATTTVFVRLGEVHFTTDDAAEYEQTTNARLLRAHQFGSANWDGCVLAGARINHTTARSTTGS